MDFILCFDPQQDLTYEQLQDFRQRLDETYRNNQFDESVIDVEQWKIFVRRIYSMVEQADRSNKTLSLVLFQCLILFTCISTKQMRRLVQYGVIDLLKKNLSTKRGLWSVTAQAYMVRILYNLVLGSPVYARVIQECGLLSILMDIAMSEENFDLLKKILEMFDAYFIPANQNCNVLEVKSSKAMMPVLFRCLYHPSLKVVEEACIVIERHVRNNRCWDEIVSSGIARKLISYLMMNTMVLNTADCDIVYIILNLYRANLLLNSCGVYEISFARFLRHIFIPKKKKSIYELMMLLYCKEGKLIKTEDRHALWEDFCTFSFPPASEYDPSFKSLVYLLAHSALQMDAEDVLILQQKNGADKIIQMLNQSYNSHYYWRDSFLIVNTILHRFATFCAYNHMAASLSVYGLSDFVRLRKRLLREEDKSDAVQLSILMEEMLLPMMVVPEDVNLLLYTQHQCTICMDAVVEVACMPCKHALFCDGCLTQCLFQEEIRRCPICRAEVSYTIELKHKKRRFFY